MNSISDLKVTEKGQQMKADMTETKNEVSVQKTITSSHCESAQQNEAKIGNKDMDESSHMENVTLADEKNGFMDAATSLTSEKIDEKSERQVFCHLNVISVQTAFFKKVK